MPVPRGDHNGDPAVESGEMEARFCEECREDKPHFFKIMTDGSAKRLRIPPAFLEHIKVSSHRAILKGPSNNIWHVEIEQTHHGMVFRKGWKRFRRDHCLEFGDFLLFRYDGNMHFSVQVFDRSACEKEGSFHVKNSKGKVPLKECQVGVESGDNMRAASRAQTDLCNGASEHKKGSNGTVEKSKEQAERTLRRSIISQRRAVTDEEKERALTAASSFRSDRPYCRIVMAPSYVYFGFFMHLPTKFRNKCLPSTACDLTLRDPSGNPWPVRYACSSRYGGLSGGWGKFTVHHNIEEGDVCVFEHIKEKELKIHIFRVVEEIVPLMKKRSNRKRHFVS